MITTQELRDALADPGHEPGPATDPQRVLTAGRRLRRHRRLGQGAAACAVVAAAAVGATALATSPAGIQHSGTLAFASTPHEVDGDLVRVRMPGDGWQPSVTARVVDGDACFGAVRVGEACIPLRAATRFDTGWANHLVVQVTTEPIAEGWFEIDGQRFDAPVVGFTERPDVRFAVALLEPGMTWDAGLGVTFVGTDASGNELVRQQFGG